MKFPWMKLFTRDWLDDMELAECPLEAQAVLVRLMCLSHECKPYGYLSVGGKPLSNHRIAVRCSMRLEELEDGLKQLKSMGRILEDEAGALYIPRMVNDGKYTEVRTECGKKALRPRGTPGGTNEATDPGVQTGVPTQGSIKEKLPPGASESESDSSSSSSKEQEKTEKPKSEFDSELEEVVSNIHDRHPAPRRCGPAVIRDRLRTIANKYPKGERIAVIHGIDKRHAGWCASEAWTKDGGEFAKGLENWLAPTMGRYMDEPPGAVAPKPKRKERGELDFLWEAAAERAAREAAGSAE